MVRVLNLFSRNQKVTGLTFQRKLRGSGILWMVFSCGPASLIGIFAVLMCHITQFLTPSWEFVTTLNYEWSVIRGGRPYRWTIWVGNHSPFFALRHFNEQQSDLLIW